MKTHITLYLFIITLIVGACTQPLEPSKSVFVIPNPVENQAKDGRFVLKGKSTKIFSEHNKDKQAIALLKDILPQSIENATKAEKAQILFQIDETMTSEAYTLNITPKQIEIVSADSSGAYYAVQTLRQIIKQSETIDGNVHIPCVSIKDKPRFVYRGTHLDVCRHFFTVEEVKRYIDILGTHKLNRFHWHLTEDQGWRIEIKKYPKLTEIGSYRKETVIGKNTGKYDGIPHQGFYTQAEIREIIDYAHQNCMEIIPEIEMPGHSMSALAAYPQYGCTGGPYEVPATWGVFPDVYCAGNDETLDFMKDILSEVIALFPGKYIHIGGDECPKDQWKVCPKCQKRIKDNKLADEHELQSWFIQNIENYLTQNNKRLIGWDEILEGGLAENATVMSWRGESGGIEAAESGHDVIMSPNDDCYFDHYQAEPIENEPFAIGGMTSVKDVYNYEPIPEKLNPEYQKHVLGAQANLWTEYIPNEKHLHYMLLPRLTALCEVLWTPQNANPDGYRDNSNRDYERFLNSMPTMRSIYDEKGWNYAKHVFE